MIVFLFQQHMLRQFSSECLMTRVENIPRGYPRNYEVHCIKGTYITKCGMVMYHHRIFRWFFVFTLGHLFVYFRSLFCENQEDVLEYRICWFKHKICAACHIIDFFFYKMLNVLVFSFFMFYFHLVCTFFLFFFRWFRMILTDIRHHSIVLTEVMHNLEVILICFVFSNICILFIYYDLFF